MLIYCGFMNIHMRLIIVDFENAVLRTSKFVDLSLIYFQKCLSYFLLHKHLISLISLTLKSIKTGAQQVTIA